MEFRFPAWTRKFWRPARFKAVYGGRCSGKTYLVAHLIILKADRKKLRILVARATATSISSSARIALIDAIDRLGLTGRWDTRGPILRNISTGSEVSFTGTGTAVRDSLRGIEGFDLVWCEESQAIDADSWETLIPSLRKEGSEIWATFNPIRRADWVYQRVLNPHPGDVVKKVSWRDVEQYLGPEILAEIENMRRLDPDLYAHIYEGEPADVGELKVLPFHFLDAAQKVEADISSDVKMFGGLDVADLGNDQNAFVSRRGPRVESIHEWRARTLGETARKAATIARREGVGAVFFDVGGVGAGIRSHFIEMGGLPFAFEGELFGGKVKGPEARFQRVANKDFFSRRNAQLAWSVRLRAEDSLRFVTEGSVPVERCLMLPKLSADRLSQLTQPIWDNDASGRIRIDKNPNDGKSPDVFDALCLAFAADSRRGLRS